MERACYHNAVTLQPSHSGDDVGLVLYGTKTRNASCSAETESCARMRAVPPGVHLDPRYFSGQGGQKKNAASTLAEGIAASLEISHATEAF
jgi:hypothetical protein